VIKVGSRNVTEVLADDARLIMQTAVEAEVDAFLVRARYQRVADCPGAPVLRATPDSNATAFLREVIKAVADAASGHVPRDSRPPQNAARPTLVESSRDDPPASGAVSARSAEVVQIINSQEALRDGAGQRLVTGA
jgi:hypothetical protein